jgi:putative ABC transport system permease protein
MFMWMRVLAVRTRSWLTIRQADQEFEHEIENHLDLLARDNLRKGMAPEEAMRTARMRMGGITQLKETNREVRGLPFMETLVQDSRYAFRMLRKNRGFTTFAILTLALGIGANTAIFSVVCAVVLKPLPYPDSGRLFNVFQEESQDATVKTGWSHLNFVDLREQNGVFSEIAASQHHQLTLTGRGEPSVVNTSVVTPEFFSLFGEKPLLGRIFFPDDGKPGAASVVILSEELWRGSFGADPNVIGTAINLDKRPFTVVGIMPATFRFPVVSDGLWIPLTQDPLFGSLINQRTGHWFQVTGRLKAGVSVAQARAELAALGARFAKAYPAENRGWIIRMAPLQLMIVGDAKPALLVLFGAVGLVLLIACANIANLLLARATSREREIAVRTTLGAGRARIVRQLLCESAVLGLLGGLTGIALAYGGVQGLTSLLPSTLPRVNAIRVDHLVLGFALFLSLFASCAFGLAPALIVANASIGNSVREGGARSGENRKSRRARNVLAAGEIGLAMVLLVISGLLLRSFAKLMSVDPGFKVQHIVRAEISLPRFQYPTPQQWITFTDKLLARVQAEPGLRDTAAAAPVPLGDRCATLPFDIVGSPPLSTGTSRTADYVSVSPSYFRVMSIPLVAGRVFDRRDILPAPNVAIISNSMARIYFPNQNPIGKQLTFGLTDSGVARQIVGIVGDVRDAGLGDAPGPIMYVPYTQAPLWGTSLLIKSTLAPSTVAAAIRREVGKIDKDLPVTDFATMADIVEASVAQPRFRTRLLTLFAGIALMLAATGIFGVISYSVSCRTQEIGVRMAVGASRRAILWMISRETLRLTVIGLAVGIPCAFAASRLVGHMLFGVAAGDPATLVLVAFVLVTVAALAGYVPARRAMRVDPVVALRHQ